MLVIAAQSLPSTTLDFVGEQQGLEAREMRLKGDALGTERCLCGSLKHSLGMVDLPGPHVAKSPLSFEPSPSPPDLRLPPLGLS